MIMRQNETLVKEDNFDILLNVLINKTKTVKLDDNNDDLIFDLKTNENTPFHQLKNEVDDNVKDLNLFKFDNNLVLSDCLIFNYKTKVNFFKLKEKKKLQMLIYLKEEDKFENEKFEKIKIFDKLTSNNKNCKLKIEKVKFNLKENLKEQILKINESSLNNNNSNDNKESKKEKIKIYRILKDVNDLFEI